MKNVMIFEHNSNSLTPVNESVQTHKDQYTLGGTFTEFDKKNRNERIYTWSKFQPAMMELNERITTLGVYGEFDHPDTFDTQLKNASHMVTDIKYNESTNSIYGEIKLLTTHWGKEARALKDEGNPLFVSSRAAGITEANGEVTLKKLFTYDIVADPGFASAKMGSLNESIGYKSDANFQIFEIEDESKINKLFEMNKDDMVTKVQLTEYSEYLVEQIASTKQKVNEVAKKGSMEPQKFNELLEYYESVQTDYNKITKYLDYLATNLQHVVSENKILKESNEKLEKTADKLIEHNDYLAENLEKTIGYTEYLAENVDKSIQYGEYIAEQLDKSIDYSNYIAENLDKSIGFSDYLSENLNKSIEYTEYIAENVDTNIAYSEYIAEHLDDGIAYTDYIAEQLDKSIGYSKMISEKLNDSKMIKEGFEDMGSFPSPMDAGFSIEEEEEDVLLNGFDGESDDELVDQVEGEEIIDDETEGDGLEEEGTNCRVVCDEDEVEGEEILDEEPLEDEVLLDEVEGEEIILDDEENLEETPEFEEIAENLENNEEEVEDEDSCDDCDDDETELTKSINKLIGEAKKRKASETNEHHFLKFLNKKQIDAFYNLGQDDQEVVAAHINEKGGYYSTEDVLKMVNEALSSKEESLETRLVRLMPDGIKETWGKISESAKTSILSQSKLHPSSKWNEDTIEHFWLTRKLPVIKENRELVSKEDKLIQEDKLTDDAFSKIMEKFGRI